MEAPSAAPSEILVTRWDNVQYSRMLFDTLAPAWRVLLYKIGARLEYRILNREELLKAKGTVPYDQSDETFADYLKDACEPIVEDNLKITFASRIVRWEDWRKNSVSLLRTETKLFWQIYDFWKNSRRLLDFDAIYFPYLDTHQACSKRLRNLIDSRSNMPIAEVAILFKQLRCQRLQTNTPEVSSEPCYKVNVPIRMRVEAFQKIKFSTDIPTQQPGLIFKGYDFATLSQAISEKEVGPFFEIKKHEITISFYSPSVLKNFHFRYPTDSTRSNQHGVSIEYEVQLTYYPSPNPKIQEVAGEGVFSLHEHHFSLKLPTQSRLSLLSDNYTLTALEVEPEFTHSSMFNAQCKVNSNEWAVTLITGDGKCLGNHALVVVEGIPDEAFVVKFKMCNGGETLKANEYFKAFFDFTGVRIRLAFTNDIRFNQRGPILLFEATHVIAMLEHVLDAPCPNFTPLGEDSSLKSSILINAIYKRIMGSTMEGDHNCYTWARSVVRQKLDFDFGKAFLNAIASLPRTITRPPEYYLENPEEF